MQLLRAETCQEVIAVSSWLRLFRFARSYSKLEQKQHLLARAISSLVILGVFAYGIIRVHLGLSTIGTVVAFYGCVFKLFEPLLKFVVLRSNLERACLQVGELRRLLATPSLLTDRADTATLRQVVGGSLVLRDVRFERQGHPLVVCADALSFLPGSHSAIIGASGAGKTTLAKIMAQLVRPSTGEVLYGDVPLNRYDPAELRRKLYYMPQQPTLFQGSIRFNVTYGHAMCQPAMIDMALFVTGMDASPSCSMSNIGPNGSRLSGGERQRVALARVLVRQPRVLIMDEATNAFDLASEREFFRRLRVCYPDLTVIAITHRVNGLEWADHVVTVADGVALTMPGTEATLPVSHSGFCADHARDSYPPAHCEGLLMDEDRQARLKRPFVSHPGS